MPAPIGYKQSAEHVAARIRSRLATLKSKGREASEAWLRKRYHEDKATLVDIGREIGRDPKTIWAWFKHYGIPTRGRGELPHAGGFQKGAPSRFKGLKHTPENRARFRAARLADGRIPCMRGGKHWLKTVPREQHPNWKGGHTPERQAFYASEEWRAACVAVWHRADAKCERCGIRHNTATRRGTFHVHHITSFSVRALRAEPSNLALLCRPCHLWVHSRKNAAREFLIGPHATDAAAPATSASADVE